MLKSVPTQLLTLTKPRASRRNLRVLFRFLLVLACMILVYSLSFHFLMLREGQEHSWITGLYWTLTVMSTLGFGDITFHTDIGRGFSIIVLLSGMVFLLVLLPFTFIEFFYEPWVRAQAARRTPKKVDPTTEGHVIITHYDAVTKALIRRLDSHQTKYVVLVQDPEEALRLADDGVRVAVGQLDDPDTYLRVRADHAAMVVTTASDVTNTSVAFTVREIAPQVPIVATVHAEASVDVLELAGSSHVLRLEDIVGQWFSRRIVGGGTAAHVIGHIDGILVAEASAFRTPLVNQTLAEAGLRKTIGVTVVGIYQRGQFEIAQPDSKILDHSVLVLAATKENLARYNETIRSDCDRAKPVVILGGGRVGRATARELAKEGFDFRIVEKNPNRIRNAERYVEGDAADLDVLQRAGIEEATSIIITTHDDEMNVYLTLYCRRLRPDAQILARSSDEAHVPTLHRAGADFVMSYASTGANTMLNILNKKRILMIAEGLDFVRVTVPPSLAGSTLADSKIRERTGCSIVAIAIDGVMSVTGGPEQVLPADAELLIVGTVEAQERFMTLSSKA